MYIILNRGGVGADLWFGAKHQVREELERENKLAHVLWKMGTRRVAGLM